ncbi:hypothetical protein CDD80_1075 [Ophiocordyceps camponoti-rufipedis]|uniref:Uncharacterized protein n=1 Tax=Ophiocordyceps camponoti-rufipedis TaxID=2004952 RepID=A0A2C5Z7F4_9HYPO|nr:hypothetical protein CDD80_1075 [Ophiocordyceps camponoti-rufipedis]
MPVQLLPASAAAFAPRASSVNVVLGSKVEPWLTQTLKRIGRVKRPLNSVSQHQRCLTETLSSPGALWNLASLMLPRLAERDLPGDDGARLFSHQLVHVEAYIVHVDMVLRNEVAFKLTTDTIDALVVYHEGIHCANAVASTYDWPDKRQDCNKLRDDFVQAVNKFVFRAHVSALDGLEEEGAGELLAGQSDEVKAALLGLMKPLVPPTPRIVVDVPRQPPLLPNSPVATTNIWSQPSLMPAVDAWRVLPSSPSMGSTSADDSSSWVNVGMTDVSSPDSSMVQLHPTPAGFFFNASPDSAFPLPSMLAPSQCGVSTGIGGFGWDRCHEYATIM